MAINKFLGLPISKTMIVVSSDVALDKISGKLHSLDTVLPTVSEDIEIKKEVEVVVGLDGKKIDLTLSNADGIIDSTFLVEVYLSGTDGKLTRVYREDVVDVINDETLSEGFSNYLQLEVDKE